jgi:cyclic pyranopterin phosphate synthase
MPASGIQLIPHEKIISFEEIREIVTEGIHRGIRKIRLTGGEPLVRKGIVELVHMIASIRGVEDLAMTTNGILLEKYAILLADAGLNRVNISLDTMSAQRYAEITRGGDINKVFLGIDAARKAGLAPIKINCVLFKSKEEKDARDVARFCNENGLQIRFIRQMNLKTGDFSVVDGGEGGDCKNCNRLRLTANGEIRPCLFNDLSYQTQSGIGKAFQRALLNKPKAGTKSLSGNFYGIGG